MFYINERILRKREPFLLRTLPTVVVFFAFIGATAISWSAAQNNIKSEQLAILNQQNSYVAERITQRMSSYEDILRGGVGLFQASENVSKSEWNVYYESLLITERYPGIKGLGYAKMIKASDKKNYEEMMRVEGYPDLQIFPSGNREVYSSVTFIEPMSKRNKQAIGYDMFANPARREAMLESSYTKSPAITNLIELLHEEDEEAKQPGFLMYLPIIDQATKATTGYVYAPFRTYDFINNTAGNSIPAYEFQIVNVGENLDDEVVYESEEYQLLVSNTDFSTERQSRDITVHGKTWKINGIILPEAVNTDITDRPNSILWSGLIFSLLIAGLLYTLLGNRTKALAQKEEESIQGAKDELLALASHQLRTPATGVKQYIGMLREGFAGKLTLQQEKLVEKAYQSNERQLNTINEMLVVAKADAGHLKIGNSAVLLNDLVRRIIEDYKTPVVYRNQRVTLKIPKRKIYVRGNENYLGMAIENIASNASKYTRNNGNIKVILKARNGNAIISVEDTGVGIAKENYHLLFKKFSRIPNDLTDKVVGSGIGLYLTKKIVESHNGEIVFRSTEGKGSTVEIILPLK